MWTARDLLTMEDGEGAEEVHRGGAIQSSRWSDPAKGVLPVSVRVTARSEECTSSAPSPPWSCDAPIAGTSSSRPQPNAPQGLLSSEIKTISNDLRTFT